MLRKKINPLLLWSITFIALTLNYSPSISLVATAEQNQAPIIRPSNILDVVSNKIKNQLNISPRELAAYANKLLAEKGFDYEFDVCEIIGLERLRQITLPSTITYSHAMTQLVGGNITLRFISRNPGAGACGECLSQIPILQVTQQEMVVMSEGKRYQLKRPADFGLDEAALVDETMKKVLRTWQLPYQTVPEGISADGTKLYLAIYEEQLDALVLELSEDGKVQFKARSDVNLQGEGERIENHPKEPGNDYLMFMGVNVGGKKYILKYSAPCT
ncbi:hypothetical protein [Argonema galeatum]|uniref:hypothetical protein n=1 Tax=Argonema galeatum TaxID=2942762 RepID=UPI0020135F91|nr:hypothetical protein [Argonema galeatum]MCL1467043.1 hypothetical protein [Argonema galeatum A003/A1]